MGRISKAGNRYLSRLLYLGAMARISARRRRRVIPTDQAPDWLDRMLARKPVKVVAPPMSLGPLAFHRRPLAARMARTVWAFAMDLEAMATHGSLARGGGYRTVPS